MHHYLTPDSLADKKPARQFGAPPVKVTRRNRTLAVLALGFLASGILPARGDLAALQQAYVDQGYGMFLHFNMGTYSGQQWSAWNLAPDTFTVATSAANPTGSIKVATDQWAATAKAAGMTYGVLTTKHHDGFELWDTAVVNSSGLSNHDIAATTWYNNPASPNYHVDVVKAYADSFRAQGLKVGLYYSIWDRNAGVGINGPYDGGDPGPAEMGHPAATTAYVKAQLLELLTNYGSIDVLWTDAWPWQTNGYENKVDYTEVYNYIKQISPDTLLLDNSVLHTMVGTDIVAYEGARPPAGNTLPSEMAGTISADGSWFYTTAGAATLKSAATLASDITFCNANHCTYLLNVPPGQDGMIPSNMIQRLADVLAVQAPGYTLTYDANGGTGLQSDSGSPYASGTTVTVLGAGAIAKPGYTFTGWNTVAIGGGTAYAPAATFSITANTTLYAQWSINTATTTVINVQYGPNNNENSQSANAGMAGLTGPSSDTGTTWNSFLGTRGANAWNGAQATDAALVDSTGNPTPVKLTFLAPDGYAQPGTGTVPIFRSAVYSTGNPINFTLAGLSSNILYDLYAIGSGSTGTSPSGTYNATFHVTGATVSASQSTTNTPGSFSAFNSGNTLLFAGLAPTAGGLLTLTLEGGSYSGSNGFQLVAHVTNPGCALTYDANGGTGSQSDSGSPYASGTTVTVQGAGTMARTGYTFTGWNTVANGGGTPYAQAATFSITANTTLYAQWSLNTYTLTYSTDANGSISSGNATQTGIPYNGSGTAVTALANTGYHFVNWDDNSTANPRTDHMVTADHSFTANFAINAINTYTLTYSTDTNGSISSGNATQAGIPYNGSGTAVTALANTGYHFVNWDDNSTDNPRTDSMVTANHSFTANFAINTYTLTYSAGANGSISSGNATQPGIPYNGSGTAVTALANTGYHFVNWDDNSTANPRTDSMVTANHSFTANFAINASMTVINVQYGPNNDSDGHYANASMAGLTGPSADTGTTWNNFLGTGYSQNAYHGAQATNAPLVSSTGAATSVKLDFLIPSEHGNALTGSNANSLPIFRSCGFGNGIAIDFKLSGLTPGTLYDLYAISGGAPSGTYAGTFHVTGATVSTSKTSTNTPPFTAFNSANALLFADLAPTADGKLILTLENTSYGTSNGFQLVEHVTNPSYTLTYDANGGTGSQSDNGSPYASGTTVTVLGAGTMARTGYMFTGWNTVAIGGGTSYAPNATFSITANTTLYAQWVLNTYTTWADNHSVTGGSNGDSDHDGILNLVEYALALNPAGSDGSAGLLSGRLLSFNKRAEAVANGDVTYTIETSTNLRDVITPGDGGWTPVTPDTNNGSIISYTLPVAEKIFARLRVRTMP